MRLDELDNKLYLGDGVYIGTDQRGLTWLYTYNGITVTNEIALEPEVIEAFKLWLQHK